MQHPFCKFFSCWFCVAVLAGATRVRSARVAEDGTATRRNIDRLLPQAISSGHSYPLSLIHIEMCIRDRLLHWRPTA